MTLVLEKETGTVKKCLRSGFHWGSVLYFRALGNTYSVKPHGDVLKTQQVDQCAYAKFNESLCAHKSLYICSFLRLCKYRAKNTV